MAARKGRSLRRGWTTGACAAAATKAAYTALLTGAFPDPVTITLPKGERPAFALAREELGEGFARAGIVKDAGDDPDVTHGALVLATVRLGPAGSGVAFRAGEGVGTVTKAGLPLRPGEPAINPVPREMMRAAVAEVARAHGGRGDVAIEIAIPGGDGLALRARAPGTLSSARLGPPRHGRLRGRAAQIPPPPPAAASHHRGRLRQDQQARGGPSRPPFGTQQGRPGLACRAARRARRRPGAPCQGKECQLRTRDARARTRGRDRHRRSRRGARPRDRTRHSRRRPGCSRGPDLRPRRPARRPRRWLSAASSSWAAPARRQHSP